MSDRKVPSSGPPDAKILIIGEAPGKEEDEELLPFVGKSGHELTKMLNEAGILRTECRITNVVKYRPPGNKLDLWAPQGKVKGKTTYKESAFDPRVVQGLKELHDEILATKPNVIVPLGNFALWAVTRQMGITKWRSSLLPYPPLPQAKIIPTIHPAAILRTWEWRYLAVHDLRRAKRWSTVSGYPEIREDFIVGPSFDVARSTLERLLSEASARRITLGVDIETTKRHLACFGIAWSRYEAICIPFVDMEKGPDFHYWSAEEELQLVLLLRTLLTHPNIQCIGQNWQYDYQYIAKYWWFEVNLHEDIMSEHHTQFPGLPKGLDFQSSLYADIHIYWKDEGKEMGKGDQRQWWRYNCKDCVRTFEIHEVLAVSRNTRAFKRTIYGTPNEIQQRLSMPYARASLRGMRVNHELRRKMAWVLQEDKAVAQAWINDIIGRPFNIDSPKQVHAFFYGELQLPKVLDRKTHKPTCNDQAIEKFGRENLLLRPICSAIQHLRTLNKFFQFCLMPLSPDGRFRCMYTIPGTETFRRASSKDPFGCGSNIQNVSQGDRAGADFPLPNLRAIFPPDEGMVMGEFDLPQADARVVAWESGDRDLIELFLDPKRHLHKENALLLFGYVPEKSDLKYYYAKQGVHLTNYGGSAVVLAKTLNITIREAERFQAIWFEKHRPIKAWHNRTLLELSTRRYVENILGFRRFYFDRIENLLKEALAWIPQSTVGVSTDLAVLAILDDEELRRAGVQFLQQGHDSALFQWPTGHTNFVVPRMKEKIRVTLPYPEPLVFEGGLKLSDKSWGELVEIKY